MCVAATVLSGWREDENGHRVAGWELCADDLHAGGSQFHAVAVDNRGNVFVAVDEGIAVIDDAKGKLRYTIPLPEYITNSKDFNKNSDFFQALAASERGVLYAAHANSQSFVVCILRMQAIDGCPGLSGTR